MEPSADPIAASLVRLGSDRRNPEAWVRVYDDLWPWVVAVMYRGLGADRALAEDAAQQVFLKLFRFARFDRIGSAAQFRSFAKAVARGVLADVQRGIASRREHEQPEDPDRPSGGSSPETVEIAGDILRKLYGAIQKRDVPIAELLLVQRCPPREIAEIVSLDVREVYASIARIRKIARDLLSSKKTSDRAEKPHHGGI